jgi:glucose/arabinose dehydrogenase
MPVISGFTPSLFRGFATFLLWSVAILPLGRVHAQTPSQPPAITPIITDLEEPWAIEALPGGAVLVTERGGRLLYLAALGSAAIAVAGVPDVADVGQGGLLDVMVPRDFASSRRVWLTYAAAVKGGAGTAAGFGTLSADGTRPVGRAGGRHFGARLVEARDGAVFVTTGDRGQDDLAQDPTGPEGKVLRFAPDGSPSGADGFDKGAFPGLYSLGHRNIQGAALDASGQLLTVEHGARGGDEVNAPAPGRNFGWPVITYGRDYDGSKIGQGTAQPGMEQPLHFWDPSIAPSGMVVYSGALWPEWQGHILTGSLNSDFISRLDPANGFAEARIQTAQTARVRDIIEAPDGAIWFLSAYEGAAYRMTPAN